MKKIKAIIKLQIPAGKANPAPPVGPALGQHGLNIAEFCKKFNDQTKDKIGYKLPVEIIVYQDRTYKFRVKEPSATEFIKKSLGIEKGSGEPNKKKVGVITKDKIREIAKKKMPDLNTTDINKASKIIEGTARSMGVTIK